MATAMRAVRNTAGRIGDRTTDPWSDFTDRLTDLIDHIPDVTDRVSGRISLPRRRSRAQEEARRTAMTAGACVAGGAAVAYFFDPANGKRRRSVARDRVAGLFRRGARKTARSADIAATYTRDKARGVAHDAAKTVEHATDSGGTTPDDQILADKVKSEVLRPDWVPKGSINVNAEAGIVYLRGEVKRPEEIDELVKRARDVEGVRAVQNLLHLPNDLAQMKQETEDETRRRVWGMARSRR